MNFGRPRPLWGGGRGVFFFRPAVRPCCGARAARGRRIGRAPRGRGEEPAEGCFSVAPSVARAQSIGRALRGARGGAGASSSRRWTVSGRGGGALGDFIGRGGEVCRTCVDCLRGGAHGVAASGRRGRRFGRLHRPRGVEVCRTCADGLRGGVHGATGVGEEAGVSVSQKRSRSNRSASSSSPPASARARAWSTS